MNISARSRTDILTVDLLAKACAHKGMLAIGVKTMVITSATFAVGVFNLKKKKKQKHEQN